MILYRTYGRAELWPDCGRVQIPVTAFGGRAEALKAAKAYARRTRKAKLRFKLELQKITVKPIGKAEIIQLFTDEDVTSLIAEIDVIQTWKYAGQV